MIKNILFPMLLLVVFGHSASGQADSSIGYQGGLNRLNKVVLDAVDRGITRYPKDEGKWHDLHFLVSFEVEADGRVGPVVTLVSDGDTGFLPRIRRAIAATSGKWINHMGEPRTVVLPITIHYEYDDPRFNQADTIHLLQQTYAEGMKKDLVFLKPMTIRSGPAMR